MGASRQYHEQNTPRHQDWKDETLQEQLAFEPSQTREELPAPTQDNPPTSPGDVSGISYFFSR